MSHLIGIDTSTTATKAILINEKGDVLGVASNEYGYETPHPLWSEQSPLLWWDATQQSIKDVLEKTKIDANTVKGIGLTGQMHGLVLLDEHGEVLRPSILWNDQRTAAECDDMRQKLGKEKLIQITGNDALTGFTAPKILWVQKNEPEIWKKAHHILLPKDYVRYKLTNSFAMDKADGAGTILFDLAKRDWSAEVLSTFKIPAEYVPKTYEGTQATGELTPEVAKEIGLPAGIPVFAGGGDQAASAVGTGAVRAGVVSISLGTSGVVFATTDSPSIEPNGRLHAFCHSVPNKWHLMGVMLSAAGSLRWHRDTFAPTAEYEKLIEATKNIPAGSDGLFFLPYLTGERTPHPDPLARAAFVGLTIRHSLPHLTKAVLEGVSFGLRDSFELMKESGLKNISQVRVTGGGARSPIWRQILADILNAEVVTVNTTEGAAYGAALLAGTSIGAFRSVEEACDATIQITGSVKPSDNQKAYENSYSLYRDLYPSLKPTFDGVA